MTISQDSSAPLIVVVGATGAQGSSVIKALAESDKPYRIKGFTRDVNKPASKELAAKGVELVVTDPAAADSKDKVSKAFEGATYAFAVTLPALFTPKEVEIAEGKIYVDAAKAANVKLLIWSGLPDVTKRSAGKYTNVAYFDAKAAVTEYAKASGVPFVNVQASGYMQNYTGHMPIIKTGNDTYMMVGVLTPDALVPLIDANADYGLFVRKAIEGDLKSGEEVYAHAEWISHAEMVKTLSEITGKKIIYVQSSEEQFNQGLASRGMPPHAARAMYEMMMYNTEFGYWEKEGTEKSLEGLARNPGTWADFVRKTDWSPYLT